MVHKVAARGLTRVPGLRRLPVLKLLALAEIAILARRHLQLLGADDRRRFLELARNGRSLTREERRELGDLVAQVEPRRFALLAADKLSPVPLPKRLLRERSRD